MVSPTHVPFEGTLKDKKTMTGHSVATWRGEDVPFVKADFSKVKATRYEDRVKKGDKIIWQDSIIELVKEIVYPHMEDYHLLIEKSKGSKYESFLHDMTEEAQSKIRFHFEEMKAAGYNITDISERQLHLLMTAYITALFEPVVHKYSYEEAIDTLSTLEKFFLPGWKQLMGI